MAVLEEGDKIIVWLRQHVSEAQTLGRGPRGEPLGELVG